MPIKGDLTRIDLANIFQMLSLNQNEGTLNIYYGGVHKSIYFSNNGIVMPFDQDTMEDRVISLLLRQGKIQEEQVERARYNTTTLNTNLLGAILQMRFVPEEDVQAAFVAQMEEDIYDLFLIKEAQFEFLEGEKPSDGKTMDDAFTLAPNNLLMEAVRRGDEWLHIQELVPTEVEVFEIVDEGLPEGVKDSNGEYKLILEAIDGVRSVKRIIEQTRLSRFTVFKNCSVLVESRKIVHVDVENLVKRADECIRSSRTWDAIDLYERAIAAGVNDPTVFEKEGYAYQSVGEHKKAVQQFYRLCDYYESKGALKQAIKIYHEIRELIPTELVARERIFQLYLNNMELFEDYNYDVLEEGRVLAQIFKEIGRSREGQEIVLLLFEAYKEDNECLEHLAQLCLDIQSPSTALSILEHLGERLLADNDSTNALRIFRRIKCIDPEHRGVDDNLDRLIEDDLVHRRKRSRVFKTIILISVLISICSAYFLFNSIAFDSYTAINYEDLMANNEFDKARDEYDGFCARFPLSIYWFLSREKLSSIDTAQARFKAAEALRLEYDRQESVDSQRTAENLFTDAMAYLNQSELENALRLFRKSSELARNKTWVQQNNIQDKIESLEGYFAEAESLAAEADDLREAGKFQEAHALLVKLVKSYGHAPGVYDVQLPLLVKTNPSGARILINGEAARVTGTDRKAVTPAVLDVAPGRSLEIRVEKEGFMAETRHVNSYEEHGIDLELRFTTECSFEVGQNLAFAPIRVGGDLVLGYTTGRIRLFQSETGQFAWEYKIKDLQSLESPLAVSQDRIFFASGQGLVTAINLNDGQMLWERQLDSTPCVAPLESGGSVFLALEDGTVMLLDAESGESKAERVLKNKAVLDPLPWDRGAILFLEDGRIVWLESEEGTKSKQRRVTAMPTAAYRNKNHLVVGSAMGVIDCFSPLTAEVLYTYDTESACPIDQIVAHSDRVFAVIGNSRLVCLNPSNLQIAGEFTLESGRLWLSHGQGKASMAVGGSDSIMYLLRSSDLSLIRKYRANGGIGFSGFELNDCGYFYSEDGVLNGLRY